MKSALTILLFLLLTSLGAIHGQAVRLNVTLSDELLGEDQWVYWFMGVGNESYIEDSCFLAKDQKAFILEKDLGNRSDGESTSWLAFSQKGPLQATFFPVSGENIQINLTPRNSLLIDVEGSPGTKERYQIGQEWGKIKQIIDDLNKSLSETTDSVRANQLTDSIAYYTEYDRKGFWLDSFNKATTATGTNLAFIFLRDAMPAKTIDSLYIVFKDRFPDTKWVQEYFEPAPPETLQSKLVDKRYSEIVTARMKKIDPNYQPPVREERKDFSKDLEGIYTYQIGDRVDSLSLKGLTGSEVSIESIGTTYLLIDFWAGWCGPCRGEFPKVKQVLNTYKDVLTIYAISLDSNEENWKKAIEADKIQQFVHVYRGDWSTLEAQKLSKQFGVTAIPANFLLDKDRKIIAMNLRGDALEEKMKELVGNSSHE